MKSVKKNFLFSLLLTTSNFLFPLLIFPYVSRVLGVQNIGICNFVDSAISYFILFSMLGISSVGIREIAKNNGDREVVNKTFSSLLLFNIVITILMLVVLLTCIFFVPKFYQYKELMLIGAVKLFFNAFLIEWFYKGLEEFRYITIRTIIIKFLYVISVFLFVKDSGDYKIYYLLTILTVVLNAVINFIYSFKFVNFSFHNLQLSKYTSSLFRIGIYMILTSLYVSFNVLYLGFVTDEIEVGYYTTSTKLYILFLSVYTAFTGVMLPRMASLVHEKNMEAFNDLLNKSINFLITFTIPIIIIVVIFSPEIIEIIAGPEYYGAVLPMRIIIILLLIIGYEQVLVIQVLMPLNKEKVILRNAFIGAIFGVIGNIVLIGLFKSVGAAIVWVIAEIIVLILSQIEVKKIIGFSFPYFYLFKQLAISLPAILICYLLKFLIEIPSVYMLALSVSTVIFYFFIVQLFFIKNDLVISTVNNLRVKLK